MLDIDSIAHVRLMLFGICRLRPVPNRDTGRFSFPPARVILGLAISLVFLPPSVPAAPSVEEITTFTQLNGLSRDQALQNLPIKIRGTVLSYDAGWGQFYVYDGKNTTWISPASFATEFRQGQYVEMTGETIFAKGAPSWTNLSAAVLGHRGLPPATKLSLSELANDFGEWIETKGQVRVVENSHDRVCLILYEDALDCQVYVLGPLGTNDYESLVGGRVRVQGINASRIAEGRLESGVVFVDNINDLTILEPARSKFRDCPVIAIDALLDRELGAWTNQPVHINGLVAAYAPGDYVLIKDPTGLIRARVTQITRTPLNERIDLWGYLNLLPNEAILSDAYFKPSRHVFVETPASERAGELNATNTFGSLSNIAQVLSLDRSKAGRSVSVRLRGVITYADSEWKNGFLQDSNSAIFFYLTQPEVRPGQWVELTGHTDPGGYAPMVADASVRILGTTNLPKPSRVDLDDLVGGRLDSHWVEMEGVVRRANAQENHLYLSMMSPKGAFNVVICGLASNPPPASLIDALVRVRGVCCSDINERQQLTGFTLQVPGMDNLSIVEAAPVDPFSIRTTSAHAVARFDPLSVQGRRVKVSGTVTLSLPGQGFYLQDESGGIRVLSAQTNELHLGDCVEVLGFPVIGGFAPHLDEAIFRTTGSGPLPTPRTVTAEEILAQGAHDSVRVQVEAQLLQRISRSANPKLVLQSGPIIFTARVVGPGTSKNVAELRPGSMLRLSGVCSVQGDERHQAEAFRLLIAKNADVAFVKAPPLWTGRQALTFGGIMAIGVMASLGWVLSLRRQVRRQTAAIQEEKNLLATLIDHLPDNVYVKNPQGRYLLTNLAHAHFHGAHTPNSFRGKTGFDLFSPQRAQMYADADAKILTGSTQIFTCEEEMVNSEGRERCMATTKVPLRDQAGKIIGLVGFSRDITEAKRAERDLVEKQRVLSTLMSNLPGLAYRCQNDADWTMEFLSEGCLELTGYAPAELVGNHRASYAQIIHPEDRQRVWEDVQQALQRHERFQLLYRIITKGGAEKWVWEQGMGIFSADGKPKTVEGFVSDVTERRRADEAVRDSEARFRAIWEHSIDGMRLTDAEGITIAVNEAFCRLVKQPRERLIGKPFSEAYTEEISTRSPNTYQESFRAGKFAPRSTTRVQLRGGEEKDLEISSCFVDAGQQGRAVLGILRDVSDRRRVESVLAYERDLLGTLFENLPDALYFKDLESRFVRVSKSKLESSWAMALARYRFNTRLEEPAVDGQVKGSTPGEQPPPHLASREAFAEYIMGKTDFDFFDKPRARRAFEDEQEIIRTGQPLIGKVEQTNHVDGRVTWSLSTKMPWRDKDGALIGTFGVSKDITAIKEAEANLEIVHKKLLDTSRQAGMAEVATGVLHNVGNVLNSVNVSANLLSEKLQQSRTSGLAKVVVLLREHSSHLGDFITKDRRGRQIPLYLEQLAEHLAGEQAQLLSEVSCLARNVDHIKNIVAMQQTYAKPAGITEPVQAVELVEDALRINGGALARLQVQIVREYDPHLPTINIDKHKVLQILVNLISNAGHACAQSQRGDKRLTIRLGDEHNHIQFCIADNGIGIAPENLTRIFSLGFTTRADGHGFGLHSGALAAKEMGGTLRSHSEGPDLGATFILELPVGNGSAS